MPKRLVYLALLVVCLILTILACQDQAEDTSQASSMDFKNDRGSAKSTSQNEHRRPEIIYTYPETMPGKTAFYVTISDAVGNPVDEAEVRLTFYVKDKFGEEYPWGTCLSNYTFRKKSDAAGNAKFSVPTIYCYNFPANIEVKKSDFNGTSKDRVEITEGMPPVEFRIWSNSQWDGANNCNQPEKKRHKFLGLF